MNKGYIYPDNSVSINGASVAWDERTFRRWRIPLVRRAQTTAESSDGVRRILGDTTFIIFPTIPLTSGICLPKSTSKRRGESLSPTVG
jgi:hypothetical protein